MTTTASARIPALPLNSDNCRWRDGARPSKEAAMKEIAYVLHLTQRVKTAILADIAKN